jgi:integrase
VFVSCVAPDMDTCPVRRLGRFSQCSQSRPRPFSQWLRLRGRGRGEIRGLMWENYQDGEIQITRSIWKGHVTEPKTRKSRGAIPVIAPLAKRLEFHRTGSGSPKAGVMFPNLSGSPMDLGNLLNRAILPALNRCAVCGTPKEECRRPLGKGRDIAPGHKFERDKILPEWHGWHAARRGLGTNLYRLGVPEKTIQAILRHANVSTTNTYYIKSAADDTRAAMAKLERLVIGNPSPRETAEHEIFASDNEVATEAGEGNLLQSSKRLCLLSFESGGGAWTRTTDLRIMRIQEGFDPL